MPLRALLNPGTMWQTRWQPFCQGRDVIADHPSFFFYLNYELHRSEKGTRLDLAGIDPYRGMWPRVYDGMNRFQLPYWLAPMYF